MSECFTVVFSGRLSDFDGNPFKAETVFGKVIAVSVGNALEENDELRDLLEGSSQEITDAG